MIGFYKDIEDFKDEWRREIEKIEGKEFNYADFYLDAVKGENQ